MLPKFEEPLTRPTPTQCVRRAVWGGMLTLSDGTNTATVAGTRYVSSIEIPDTMTMTGIAFLVGLTGGVDKVIVELHDSQGEVVATSATAGVTVGSAGTVQQVPFINQQTIMGPGLYYLAVQFNGATATFRSLAAGTSAAQTVNTSSQTGVFGTPAVLNSVPATFTADTGPIAFTY